MTRNLKALGLTMAAVLVLGAVYASAASAQQGELTSDGPVTLTVEETGPVSANRLTGFGAAVQCPGSTGVGHKWQATPHGFLNPSGETTFTLTPEINEANRNCVVAGLGWTATTDFNGCDYVVHLGGTVDEEDHTYTGSGEIDCPTGNEITWTVWTASQSHIEKPSCIFHIPEQSGLQGPVATDTTNGHIDIEGAIEGITARRTGTEHGGVLCPKGSVTHTGTVALDLDLTVSGHDEEEEPTDIALSHNG